MKQFYCYDAQGYYKPGEDYISEKRKTNSTDTPPVDAEGRGMYKPRFVDGVWIEEGSAPAALEPPVDEVAMLRSENERLNLAIIDIYEILLGGM